MQAVWLPADSLALLLHVHTAVERGMRSKALPPVPRSTPLLLKEEYATPEQTKHTSDVPMYIMKPHSLPSNSPSNSPPEDLGGDSIRRTLIVGECVRSSDPCLIVSSSDPCLRGRPLAPPTGPGGEEESPFVDGSSTEGPSLRRAEGGEIEVGGGGKEDGG